MMMIETIGLRKGFKSKSGEVEAVRGVDLSVGEGDIFGFLGPNGAGKSTTVRMLATLLKPDGGEARVAGHDLTSQPGKVRARIGYVSQSGGATPDATGRENLMLQAQLYGATRAQAAARTEELLGRLSLAEIAERPFRTYSGGQKRRLDIALGMVHKPALLFLDEPSTGLDPQSRAELWRQIRLLNQDGTTIFITTHYMDEADALCQRLAIIDNGRIVAEDTPDALKRGISGDIVTLGLDAANGAAGSARELLSGQPFVLAAEPAGEGLKLSVERGEEALPVILRLMDGAGLAVREITLSRPTLEDVFLKQTGRSLRETTSPVAPAAIWGGRS